MCLTGTDLQSPVKFLNSGCNHQRGLKMKYDTNVAFAPYVALRSFFFFFFLVELMNSLPSLDVVKEQLCKNSPRTLNKGLVTNVQSTTGWASSNLITPTFPGCGWFLQHREQRYRLNHTELNVYYLLWYTSPLTERKTWGSDVICCVFFCLSTQEQKELSYSFTYPLIQIKWRWDLVNGTGNFNKHLYNRWSDHNL